jgi:DNA-binding response OmpR family regulator
MIIKAEESLFRKGRLSMTKRRRRGLALVIEDEADILKFASRVLSLEGFTALEADNGDRGLELARQNKCALVFLDLRLPRRDGWSVLAEMKSDPNLRAVPVIVFTASPSSSEREKALSMSAVDYLAKPLSAADLRASVARALEPMNG